MKRDIVIAIVIGFVAGALVAALLLNLPQIIAKLSPKSANPSTNTTVTLAPQKTSVVNVEITQPLDESIADSKTIYVKGTTQAQNFIILENNAFQDVVAASADGSFAIPITLNLGTNDMNITVYNRDGESSSKTVTVLYQEEKL